jgi:uncharacterized protein (TIGR00725 family)
MCKSTVGASLGQMKATIIGIIGESRLSDQVHGVLAEEVGRLVASAGYTLVCGGLGGVMEAACRGAQQAGGRTIGILPGTDRSEANPYVEIAVPTGSGYMRNVMIVLTADVLIAIGGGFGTLSEIGHALGYGKSVIGLRTWEAARAGGRAPIIVVDSPEQALEAVDRALHPQR